MIGMMYLVLTALLALNVSKDILEAFVLVDDGLTKTTENFNTDNSAIYAEFEKASVSNPAKVAPWKAKALEVRTKAEELFNYIQDLKIEIITKADGKDAEAVEGKRIEIGKVNAKDNTDKPAELMVGANNTGKGKELRAKIAEFRETLIKLAGGQEGLIKSLNKTLDTSDPPPKEGKTESWESEHFEHLPLIAVTTIMSKMQSDVRNAESEIIRYLYNQIEAGSFKFNKLEGTVIANSNYIIKGNTYQADVFIAAFDTTQKPVFYLGNWEEYKTPEGNIDYRMVGSYDSTVIQVDPKTGKGVFKQGTAAVGPRKWGGLIKMIASDGTTIRRPFRAEYQVADANAVISPTKMNVFYIGVDNPVDISVPGVPSDKVFASIANGNGIIRRDGKAWVAIPRNVGEANVLVQCDIDGSKKTMGSMKFRVKNIPDPIGKVAGRKGGYIDKQTLGAQMLVVADLENFDFDAKFTVTEFVVSATIRSFVQEEPSKSNRITDRQREIIRNLNRGDKVYFDNIKAVGPDGKQRELPTISFKIQ
jgi:gliding motility-associated protein GldM